MLKNIKAVVFDMDGVIFDSEQFYYDARMIIAKRNNIAMSEEDSASFVGKSKLECKAILKRLLDNNQQKADQFWNDAESVGVSLLKERGIVLKSGFLDLFEKIKQQTNLDIGLVTSAEKHVVTNNFGLSKQTKVLETFKQIVTYESVKNHKPNPEPYLLSASLLGYKPKECIAIEDSIPGVTAALGAGFNTIMISGVGASDQELEKKLLFKANKHQEIIEFLQNKNVI